MTFFKEFQEFNSEIYLEQVIRAYFSIYTVIYMYLIYNKISYYIIKKS